MVTSTGPHMARMVQDDSSASGVDCEMGAASAGCVCSRERASGA